MVRVVIDLRFSQEVSGYDLLYEYRVTRFFQRVSSCFITEISSCFIIEISSCFMICLQYRVTQCPLSGLDPYSRTLHSPRGRSRAVESSKLVDLEKTEKRGFFVSEKLRNFLRSTVPVAF